MASDDFIGNGWAFPAGINRNGSVRLVTGTEEVDAAIRMILSTVPGERVMRPDFGCGLRHLAFEPITDSTLALLRLAVRTGLSTWEPRIEVEAVSVSADESQPGRVLIDVGYRIRTTNTFFNLVYPFYLQEARA